MSSMTSFCVCARRFKKQRRLRLPNDDAGQTHRANVEIENKKPAVPARNHSRQLWPVAWLTLTGLITLGWMLAIGRAAFDFVRWLAD